MSKRKRAPIGKSPATSSSESGAEESADDAAVKDDMVHVNPDLLAGSPDIFAGKKADAGASAQSESETEQSTPEVTSDAGASAQSESETEQSTPEVTSDVGAIAQAESETERFTPEVTSEPPEPTEVSTTPAPAETPAFASEPPPTHAPPLANAVAYPPRPRRGGSTSAIGIMLVVIGIFALAVVLSGVDFTENGWPLFIIIPGLTLMVVGFFSVGGAATIPGGVVTMLGVVLAYTSSTGDWPFWAYGWSLVTPFGIGLGMYLQALRDRDQHALRTGRSLLGIGVMIFLVGFVLFESILGISGRDYFGPAGKAALPLLLILVGVILLVRSIQRSRKT